MNRQLAKSTLLIALFAVVFSSDMTGVGVAGASTARPSSEPGRAQRVLIYSVPTLTFQDLRQNDLPNLKALLAKGAVADLSTRGVYRTNKPGDGYATLNAGTRSLGTSLAGLAFVAGTSREDSADGDPLTVPPGAFEDGTLDTESDENVISAPPENPLDPSTVPSDSTANADDSRTPAAQEFARRTGVTPPVGSVFNFGLVSMLSVNGRLLFDSEIGALGNALNEAGVSRAVIANGDQGPGLDDMDFRREASLGLIDSDGIVELGRVGRSLLESSRSAPFGAQFNMRRVESAFEGFFKDRSVVLVEASDMVRSEEAKPLSTPTRQVVQRRDALERSDELLGRLLEHVDLDKDAVLVISPYAAGYGNGLTALGLVAPGVEPGLLISGSTRRAGFVQTVDIAPSVISLVGAKTPTSMEGTLMESVPDSGTLPQRIEMLDEAFQAAVFRDSTIGAVSTFFVLIQVLLWVGAIWAMTATGARLSVPVQVASLGVLAFLPSTFIAGAFPFHRWGGLAYWSFVLGLSAIAAIACYLGTRRYLVDPLMTMLALIIAFLSVDIITGGVLQFNTVFGYTPTVAGRFDGMGNPAYSMFTAAAIILAALIAYRIPGRRGIWIAISLLVWIILVDGVPIWGADVGGALSLIPTVGVMALLLLKVRVKLSTVIWLSITSVVLVTTLAYVDYRRPPTARTHLGRLFANTMDNGFGAFETVILRKLNANLSVLMSSVWTLMLPLVFLAIAIVFWRAPGRLRTISDQIPQERAAVIGLCVAMFLGFALNDSGIAVPGMMLGVINASLVHLMVRANSPRFIDAVGQHGVREFESDQPVGEQSALT
ncbi:MAG: hypothetical protein KDB26_06395 [Microthrixaceae bacterium]|nr:hypothetical protein [Microthrixaceae bacterium]